MYAPDHLKRKQVRDVMYRSNSSLDLIYADHSSGNGLRREYGSHGSIDVIGGTTDRLPAMVHNFNSVSSDKPQGIGRDRLSDTLASDHADGPIARANASPKQRLKLNKLWGGAGPTLSRPPLDDGQLPTVSEGSKRRQFAHYDCQSLISNLSYAAEVRGALLSRRRNTTTGASAASLLATRGLPPGEDALTDCGDGRSNELLECCPFFRNELGGEEDRCVSLCWKTGRGAVAGQVGGWHRPRAAYGISLLEFPQGQTHWKNGCPFIRSSSPLPVESQDQGALYYRKYFYNQPHQNWFGMDENLGPVAISIKKERVELRRGGGDSSTPASQLAWQYRLIVRTSELLTLRGSILEDSLPNAKPSNNSSTYNTKDVLDYVAPELPTSCLRLGLNNTGAEEQLLRLDEQCVTRHYKVGVMYCKSGQATEEEMYNNQEAGPAFVEFLQTLGQTVRLKDFDKYKAGLDNKTDSTGLYSVYTTYQGCEIMFHVSTMLPYTPNNRQQLLRKRHIGNDIVTIVFQEPGAARFTPKNIRSQFQHVFVVVRAIDPCTDNTRYSIAVSRAKEVPLFGPPIKDGAVYPKGETFTDLLLSKVINGENAAIQAPKFSTMATRTRQEYLKDLAKNYISASTVESGQKFSIFSSLLMKSASNSNNNAVLQRVDNCANDVLVGGALYFHVQLQDEGAGGILLDCIMGVSTDTIVLIEESSRQIVLAFPTNSLLGWVSLGSWTRVYYHCGESVRVRVDGGAGGEAGGGGALERRLRAVAPPNASALHEMTLQRQSFNHLGFHVQPDGVVTAVEAGGLAARGGLRAGGRLLEVCRAAVVALHHDTLVDLLKTSDPVTVIVTFASCSCSCQASSEWAARRAGTQRAAAAQRPARARRAHSPPRSDTSGYGTGGSRGSRRSPPRSPARVRAPSTRHKRASANTTSLTEELMRLMDAQLGEGEPRVERSRPVSGVGSPGGQGHTVGPVVGQGHTVGSMVGQPNAVGPASGVTSPGTRGVDGWSLPLPDTQSLDWATLVRTATRAMLQICEEHQYPSLENTDPSLEPLPVEPVHDSWTEIPTSDMPSILHSQHSTPNGGNTPNSKPNTPSGNLYGQGTPHGFTNQSISQNGSNNSYSCQNNTQNTTPKSILNNQDGLQSGGNSHSSVSSPCGCGLSTRVASLEAEAINSQRQQHQLEEEVRRLRRNNAKLREESARAVWQLRHFTQWLKRTVDKQ